MNSTTLLFLLGAASAADESQTVGLDCTGDHRRPDLSSLPHRPASVATVQRGGASLSMMAAGGSSAVPANRLDLVFVGDGYTASELGLYANRVDILAAGFFDEAPYDAYESYFNVHRVDVVSNESGVDGDPGAAVQRDTALDMGFAITSSSAGLNVDLSLAWAFAQNAPAADVVAAIANSSKYGGSGYPWASLGTAPGSNSSSRNLLKHELGHGLGKLADEYFTFGTTYDGPEHPQPNASILSAEEMLASGTKWAAWIGYDDDVFNGPVQSFVGGKYFQFGNRRPSGNSKMRSLGGAFNAPSAESLVIELYKFVLPIDDSSDPNLIHNEFETLFVTPMQPATHDLQVSWVLDGQALEGAAGHELQLCSLALSAGWHAALVTVTDQTPLVRNEVARAQFMTQTLLFPIFSTGGAASESFCDSTPNSTGSRAEMSFDGSTGIAQNDLELEVDGAVPGQPGLFISGTRMVQLPFGDGFRCAGGAIARFPVVSIDTNGSAAQAIDFTNFPNDIELQAGEERTFQFWHRDPAASGSGFNLSNGLLLRLCP